MTPLRTRPDAAPARERPSEAASDVLAERRRQVEAEGWTSRHDDEHGDGEMALAASLYVLHSLSGLPDREIPEKWPWHPKWWRPKDRRNNFVRAAALIIAEIERLDRAALEGK